MAWFGFGASKINTKQQNYQIEEKDQVQTKNSDNDENLDQLKQHIDSLQKEIQAKNEEILQYQQINNENINNQNSNGNKIHTLQKLVHQYEIENIKLRQQPDDTESKLNHQQNQLNAPKNDHTYVINSEHVTNTEIIKNVDKSLDYKTHTA